MHRVTIWPAGTHRRHVNEYRPDLFHPAIVVTYFEGADSAASRAVLHRETRDRGTIRDQPEQAAECAHEAQQHGDTQRQRSGNALNHSDTVAPSLLLEPLSPLHPGSAREGVATDGDARSGAPPALRVAVPRRARVDDLIQQGLGREAALRFATLEQGWIEGML